MQVERLSARIILRERKDIGICDLNERISRCKSIYIVLPVYLMNLKKEGVR